MQIGCQIYVKGSAEAVALYQKAFNWTIGMNFKNPEGEYAHASLMCGEREMLAVAENGSDMRITEIQSDILPIMSFNCSGLKSREAVDKAYIALSEEASATGNSDGPKSVPWSEYCFSLVDKFGVHWWIAI